MSIWFLLWLVLSASLLYFLFWTLYILYRQKGAWKIYAAKKNLRYVSKSLLASPELSGITNDYTVTVFTGEHGTEEGKGTRKLTAVEVNLASHMPFDGGIASGGMVPLVKSLNLKEEFVLPHAGWDKNAIAASANRAALELYLTPARQEAIVSLMKMRNAWVILLFRGDVMLLRIDTPDPLDSPKKLDHILRRMTDTARLLELKSDEIEKLKAARTRTAQVAPKPVSNLSQPISFELEDDSPAANEKPPLSPEENGG